jgi:hypothetical protein
VRWGAEASDGGAHAGEKASARQPSGLRPHRSMARAG